MNMRQFTGWFTGLLDALPWRRARRPASQQTRARLTTPSPADRFAFPDAPGVKRQKAETNPLCSTLHEDSPADDEPAPPSQPRLKSIPPAPEAPSTALVALPTPPAMDASDAKLPKQTSEAKPCHADPERRLAFARFLVRRGVFNEGFARESLPAQYQDRAGD